MNIINAWLYFLDTHKYNRPGAFSLPTEIEPNVSETSKSHQLFTNIRDWLLLLKTKQMLTYVLVITWC